MQMDYNKLIEQTKKALESYSDINTQIEALYKKAKEKNLQYYETAKKSLKSQYFDDKNRAVVKGQLDQKDTDQFLAARGLTTSGESVQAKIDTDISVNNALQKLAQANQKALSDIELKKLEKDIELDTAHAQKKLEYNKQMSDLALGLADRKTKSGQKTETIPNKTETIHGYTPKATPKELTNSIIESFAPEGRIETDSQKSYIKAYLEELEKDGIDNDFIKEVIMNLKVYGYSDLPSDSAENFILVDRAKAYYDKIYGNLYGVYIKGNRTTEQAHTLAQQNARKILIDFVYEHIDSASVFENICRRLGISKDEIDEYYDKLGNKIKYK